MSGTSLPCLVPRPRKMRRRSGTFRLPSPFVMPAARGRTRFLVWDLQLLERALRSGPGVGCGRSGRRRPALTLECGFESEAARERYRLRISRTGISISAPAVTGLRMGIRTLAQIVEQAKSPVLPCLDIDDEPALSFRAVHLDMKDVRHRVSYLEEIFDGLAAMKINAVVLEYEDKFPFSKTLGVAGDDAYTRTEVRRIVSLLLDRGIMPVPLQQCFGHLNYVMKHPRYARLREDHVHAGQPCPLIPASGRLMRRLLDEMADLHPGVPWFHMGGDEVRMGACPRCARKAKRHSVSRIYMDFVEPLADHMITRGYKPMLWADPFLRYYEENRRLAGRVTLVDWNYGAAENARAAYFWRQYREMTPEEFHERYDETRHRRAFAKHFPKPGGPVDPLYTSRYLQDRGYRVVGAPAVSTGFSLWMPGAAGNLDNVICHARSAHAKGCEGILVTRWSECVPHWEPCWPGFAAGAAYAWNPGVTVQTFEKDLCRMFWGLPDARVLESIRKATAERPLLSSYKRFGPYDGAAGKRDVRGELEELLVPGSVPEMVKRSRRVHARMAALGGMASKAGSRAARHKRCLDYIELAAWTTMLRATQMELLLGAVMGRPVSPARWRATEKRARELRSRARGLLRATVSGRSMKRFLSMHFDGEEELPQIARPDRIFEILGR